MMAWSKEATLSFVLVAYLLSLCLMFYCISVLATNLWSYYCLPASTVHHTMGRPRRAAPKLSQPSALAQPARTHIGVCCGGQPVKVVMGKPVPPPPRVSKHFQFDSGRPPESAES